VAEVGYGAGQQVQRFLRLNSVSNLKRAAFDFVARFAVGIEAGKQFFSFHKFLT
jgi:hypothetical protein